MYITNMHFVTKTKRLQIYFEIGALLFILNKNLHVVYIKDRVSRLNPTNAEDCTLRLLYLSRLPAVNTHQLTVLSSARIQRQQ